jgi:exoribonuclease II
MIEELAIQTNNIIANIIIENKGNQILGRCCTTLNRGILTETGNFILDIISNEFRAKYGTQIDKHVILNLEIYCHFTSPLRRFSDCITHFILKHNVFQGNTEPLFNDRIMDMYTMICNNAARKHRNASFADNKYRLYQYIRQELESREYVELKYVHSGMTGNFINALVIGIDGYNTNITYTLVSDNKMDCELIRSFHGIANTIHITECNIQNTKYDKGSLPELEEEMVRYFG